MKIDNLLMDPYMVTISGNHFELLDLSKNTVNIEEIAHSLALTCRFGGHCREFYSVAQHSVIVARLVPENQRLSALFHDAMEAYLGDIPSPLKQLLSGYKILTKRAEDWFCRETGYDIHTQEIKYADLQALGMEKRDLMPHDYQPWPILDGIVIPEDLITPLPPVEAFELFIETYELYTGAIQD